MLIAAALLLFTLLCIALSDDLAWDNVTRPARNELVFDGRHRAYGAFQLRRGYDRRFVVAFLGAVGLLGTMITAARFLSGNSIPEQRFNVTVFEPSIPPVDIPTVKPDPPAPAGRPAPSTPGAGTIIVIDSTRLARDTAFTAPPLPPGPIGPEPGPGVPPPGPPGGGGVLGGGGGTGLLSDTVDIGWVEEQPEFPGGEAAMHRFIQEHVRFPNAMETKSRIYVGFVVDDDGTVLRVQAKNGGRNAFAQEAERVMRQMPKWIPAKMNGRPVKCRLVLPISFELK